jgi:hypothetical protein
VGIGVDDVLDDRDLAFFEAVAAQVAQTIIRAGLIERSGAAAGSSSSSPT